MEKLTEQIKTMLISTSTPLSKDIFDLNFSQLVLQALMMADMIIKYSDVDHKVVTNFKKLLTTVKDAHKQRPLYDED